MADTILVNKDFYIKIETEVFNDAAGFGGYLVNEITDVQTPMSNPFAEIINATSPSPLPSATVDVPGTPSPSPAVLPAGTRIIPVVSNTLSVGDVFNDGAGTWDNNNGQDWHLLILK